MRARGRQRPDRRLAALAALVLTLALPGVREASAQYDPALRFRTLETPHFRIHFHPVIEDEAQRLALIAEDVHATLASRLRAPVAGPTHVILVDQSDLPNGWATPLPYNTIEVTVAAPAGFDLLGHADDWLRLVFTHEYVHILHLDRSRGWAAAARRVFGRTPFAFPNLFLPIWTIEGIATYYEGVGDRGGRPADGNFAEVLRAGRRSGRVEPIDRAGGGLADWPGGLTPYVYGAFFHAHLAERFGEEALVDLADATAARVPYFQMGAFRRVFGESVGELWSGFVAARPELAAPPAPAARPRRLTFHGFTVARPRWDRHAPDRILYHRSDPRGFPSLMGVHAGTGRAERLADQFVGAGSTASRDAVYFDQLDLTRNVALFGDLYRLDRAGGRVRRLTREGRFSAPDLAPDGRTIAAILLRDGRRGLALVDLADAGPAGARTRLLVFEADGDFALPRWSPDGRWVAAERRRRGGDSELVLVDAATGDVRTLTAARGVRHAGPAWLPDGGAIVFGAAAAGEPFQLHAVDLETGERFIVMEVEGGARAPDVSSDGRQIVYVGYTPDGFDLFTVPLDRAAWRPAGPPYADQTLEPPPATAPEHQAAGPLPSGPYRPRRTLLPTSWTPQLAHADGVWKVGAAAGGVDALRRHAYGASVLVPVTARQGRADWSVGYAYDRFRPTWFAATADWTDYEPAALVRHREAATGVLLPLRRVRRSQTLFGGLALRRDERACRPDAPPPCGALQVNRHALRAGWRLSTARTYGYSISSEEGGTAALTWELVRRAWGADGNASAVTLDGRVYQELWPRHAVLAVRGAGGLATGDQLARRRFQLGGSGPRPAALDFGDEVLALLRGFERHEAAGSRAGVLNLDYRLPLAYIQRGYRAWPLFIRSVHGAVFADFGVVSDETPGRDDLRRASGVELSADAIVGHYALVTLTGGVAWRHDRTGAVPAGPVWYARLGRAF